VPAISDDDHERILELADLAPMRERTTAAFASLPPGQRQALGLRVIHDCSYTEVARRLGISEQTARARVSRALRRLAENGDEPEVIAP
jgi:RNA polymerase sigma-70 factor (ECF subfamily)